MTQTPNPLSNNESVKRETPKVDFGSRSQADEFLNCPACLNKLEYRESTFPQYQPSVYYCIHCKKYFGFNYVRGFNDGLNRRTPNQTDME